MNVLLEYMYRDTGNYKQSGEVTFSNKQGTDIDELVKAIESKLLYEGGFVAEKTGIPVLYFDDSYDPELDHPWHEFVGLTEVDTATDANNRDISEFITALRGCLV
ncbi:MAG: hypothetical protein ACR2P9_04450 [Gammaproteobacteria bacterium]